jgi:hypothetical protein
MPPDWFELPPYERSRREPVVPLQLAHFGSLVIGALEDR